MAVFAGYRRLEAANGSNNGLFQAGMAFALIAAISGPMPMMFMTHPHRIVLPMKHYIISVIDVDTQNCRDKIIERIYNNRIGKRGQPPMTERLQVIDVLVQYLEKEEKIRFGTAPTSRMNKAVGSWLNERMKNSADPRKSRRKIIGPDAVRVLLHQLKDLRQ